LFLHDEAMTTDKRSDYLGYVLFAIPPSIGVLVCAGLRLNQFVLIPLFLAITLLSDAPRWNLPRWVWVPLIALFWPVALPGYGFVRRFNGATVHWSLGLACMVVWYFLFDVALQAGRAF
jgi:hypothetical protein